MTGVTRRQFWAMTSGAAVMLASRACAEARDDDPPVPIGLFAGIGTPAIPSTVSAVRTRGYHVPGEGAGDYVHDAVINDDYLLRHRSSAFAAADGRRFRLRTGAVIDPRSLGLRTGLGRGFAGANRQAITDALDLGSTIVLPAGDIDLTGVRPFDFPARNGISIAGQGWTTRLVTSDTAFMLPTLSHLEIRDLWIEQAQGGASPIQSYHQNLRDIRLLRLKITMRDQATCQGNCISLVFDGSPPGPDGITGVDGLRIEGCWLAPGRMGIEIQMHRPGDDRNKLYGYRNVVMKGCTVWEAPAFAGMGISLTGWGTDCIVEGNRFVGCHGPNVEIIGSDRLSVVSNVFERPVGSPIVASNFRVVQGLRVLNNRTAGTPPIIGFALNAVDGADVAGNRMSTRGTFQIKGTNVRVHDNELTGTGTTQIIQLDNAHRVVIERNMLHSVGRAPQQAMVIAFNHTTGCIVRNNRMQRDDADPHRNDAWFYQAAPAIGSRVYANERRTAHGVVREHSR